MTLAGEASMVEQAGAYSVYQQARREGKLIPQPCARCGATKSIHGHHEDYAEPLEVIWLCRRHHAARHKEINIARENAVLIRLIAMLAAGITTRKEISEGASIREGAVNRMLAARTERPSQIYLDRLRRFAANRTLHISRRPALAERYRREFEAACEKFPTKEEKK